MSRRRTDIRGFTLIEVTIVMAVVSVLTLLIVEALANLSRSQAFSKGQSRIAETSDRVMRGIVKDVTYSVRVFADGLEGDAYLAAMDYPSREVVAEARLPLLTDHGFFTPDTEEVLETGNILFLVRYNQPFVVQVQWGGVSRELRVDTVRFVLYYPRLGRDRNIDLARWGSMPVALHGDLMMIPDAAERTSALVQLHDQGVRFVWDKRAPPAESLYEVSEEGVLSPVSAPAHVAGEDAQCHGSLLGARDVKVARNGRIGGMWVPAYAQPGPTGFPGGFEVKVDGPSTGKLVLMRLLLRSGPGGSGDNFSQVLRIVSCRDG